MLTLLLFSLFLSFAAALKTGSSNPLSLNLIAAYKCSKTLPFWPGDDRECFKSRSDLSSSSTLASKVTLDPLCLRARTCLVASSGDKGSSKVYFDELMKLLIRFDGFKLLLAEIFIEFTPFVDRVDLEAISRPPGIGLKMPLNSCLICLNLSLKLSSKYRFEGGANCIGGYSGTSWPLLKTLTP